MKSSDIKKLCEPFLPLLPQFVQKGSLIYDASSISTGLLRGIYFEDSGFDSNSFYLWALFLPLYTQNNHISFTFGKRLARGKRWTIEASDPENIRIELTKTIQHEALPFLNRANTPEDFAEIIDTITNNIRDPYALQAKAYSLAKSDRSGPAIDSLKKLIIVLHDLSSKAAWTDEMRNRAEWLLEHLISDPASTKRFLADLETLSLKNLRLINYQ